MTREKLESHRAAAAAILVAAAWLCLPGRSFALDLDGFMQEQGHGDVAVSVTSENYSHFWAGKTRVSDPGVGAVRTTSVSLWFSYGINDRVTLVGNIPYVHADSDGLGGFEERSFQDLSVAAKVRIASFGSTLKSRVIGVGGFRIPTSSYEANIPVDTGDGTDDWLLGLIYQLRFRNFYASQQVGYSFRGGDAPNDVPLYTELGLSVGRVTFAGTYARLVARGGTDIGDPGFTFPSNKEEYERVGGKVFGRVSEHVGISAAFFKTLNGRNTGDTRGLSCGLDLKF